MQHDIVERVIRVRACVFDELPRGFSGIRAVAKAVNDSAEQDFVCLYMECGVA
jgi:hypothetical protein